MEIGKWPRPATLVSGRPPSISTETSKKKSLKETTFLPRAWTTTTGMSSNFYSPSFRCSLQTDNVTFHFPSFILANRPRAQCEWVSEQKCRPKFNINLVKSSVFTWLGRLGRRLGHLWGSTKKEEEKKNEAWAETSNCETVCTKSSQWGSPEAEKWLCACVAPATENELIDR